MTPILDLVAAEQLADLASRSNFRYGKEIAKHGEISLPKSNRFHLQATVKSKNGQTRTVSLLSTPKGLRWKCTCTSRKDLFCKHCVAAGLVATT